MARTVCRVCESGCGLVVDVVDNRVAAIRPDADDAESRGYACARGLGFGAIRDAPDRPVTAWIRRGDRQEPAAMDAAVAEVGARLRAIADAHGPDAIGLYAGNATAFCLPALAGLAALQRGIGTRALWTALSLDNAAQLHVAEHVVGNPLRLPVPDIAGADLFVAWGTDPLSSQVTNGVSDPRGVFAVRSHARNGTLVVVDPRSSATARAAGLHVAVRPGGDVALLAWLAHQAATARGRPTPAPMATLEQAAVATDLPQSELIALRDRLLAAQRPCIWHGLGVMLGHDGTVGTWLVWCLMDALGPLDRPGGWRWATGRPDLARWADRLGVTRPVVDPMTGHPCVLGARPAAFLPDWIRSDRPDRPRALVVIGGDPMRTLPGPDVGSALGRLDLLVAVDIRWSETARRAHALLPVTTFLERKDLGTAFATARPLGRARRSDPVVDPRNGLPDEWALLVALCRAGGWSPFGIPGTGPIAARLHPADVLGWVSGEAIPYAPRTRLDVPHLRDAAARALGRPAPRGTLLITSIRAAHRMNSWLGAPTDAAHTVRDGVVARSFADGANDALERLCEPVLGVPVSNGQPAPPSGPAR